MLLGISQTSQGVKPTVGPPQRRLPYLIIPCHLESAAFQDNELHNLLVFLLRLSLQHPCLHAIDCLNMPAWPSHKQWKPQKHHYHCHSNSVPKFLLQGRFLLFALYLFITAFSQSLLILVLFLHLILLMDRGSFKMLPFTYLFIHSQIFIKDLSQALFNVLEI